MNIIAITVGFLGALFLGYGFALLEKAFDTLRLRRRFLTAAPEKIASMKGPVTRLRGVAQPCTSSITGPFSEKECLYYKYQIMKRAIGGRPVRIRRGSREISFCLDDGSGEVTVDGKRSRFTVTHETFKGEDLSPEGKDRLIELLSLKNPDRIKEYQIIEEYLPPGEVVTVVGHVSTGDQGNLITASKRLPVLVMQCSEEAFVVLYTRALMRLLLMSLCFLVTGLFDFFLLFMMLK
jgi:hypothetical protein